jgi:hypothetical protein
VFNYTDWTKYGKKWTKRIANFVKSIRATKMYTQLVCGNGNKKGQQKGEGYVADSKISVTG